MAREDIGLEKQSIRVESLSLKEGSYWVYLNMLLLRIDMQMQGGLSLPDDAWLVEAARSPGFFREA